MFGTSNLASLHVNKITAFTLTMVDQIIAVSHTLRENIHIRSGVPPHLISVIPNAIDSTKFSPSPTCQCEIQVIQSHIGARPPPSSSSSSPSPHNHPMASQDHLSNSTWDEQVPPTTPQPDGIGNPICTACHLPRQPYYLTSPTIVLLSRLVYRKGIEFVLHAIPLICDMYPNVKFVVGMSFIPHCY